MNLQPQSRLVTLCLILVQSTISRFAVEPDLAHEPDSGAPIQPNPKFFLLQSFPLFLNPSFSPLFPSSFPAFSAYSLSAMVQLPSSKSMDSIQTYALAVGATFLLLIILGFRQCIKSFSKITSIGRNTMPTGGDFPFNHLEPLAGNMSNPKPDYYNGSQTSEVHPQIKEDA
jgi:hypothetical protein